MAAMSFTKWEPLFCCVFLPVLQERMINCRPILERDNYISLLKRQKMITRLRKNGCAQKILKLSMSNTGMMISIPFIFATPTDIPLRSCKRECGGRESQFYERFCIINPSSCRIFLQVIKIIMHDLLPI